MLDTFLRKEKKQVAEAGFEPAHPLWIPDFKSGASAIPPLGLNG